MWLLSSVGYNFRSVSAFIGCYSCGLHRPWGNNTLLPQSSFTLLRWVLTSDSSRRTQVVLGTDTAVEVKSPSYNPARGYIWKKGQWPPLRAEYLPSSTREPYQIRGSLSSSPSVWSSTFHPRTPDLAWYCLGRWMLRQSTCFAFDFWLSCASPSENGDLSWEAFFLGKNTSCFPFVKIVLDGPGLQTCFSVSEVWGSYLFNAGAPRCMALCPILIWNTVLSKNKVILVLWYGQVVLICPVNSTLNAVWILKS